MNDPGQRQNGNVPRRSDLVLTAAVTAWLLVVLGLAVAVGVLINGGVGSYRLTFPTGPGNPVTPTAPGIPSTPAVSGGVTSPASQ